MITSNDDFCLSVFMITPNDFVWVFKDTSFIEVLQLLLGLPNLYVRSAYKIDANVFDRG